MSTNSYRTYRCIQCADEKPDPDAPPPKKPKKPMKKLAELKVHIQKHHIEIPKWRCIFCTNKKERFSSMKRERMYQVRFMLHWVFDDILISRRSSNEIYRYEM